MDDGLLATMTGDDSSSVVGLHVLSTDYESRSGSMLEDLSSDDCGRSVIAIPALPPESSNSMLGKEGDLTLTSSFIPENAVLVETPRGLMLTVPENINAISYDEDQSPGEQSQQLLSCIPVSFFSACDTTVDVDAAVDYENELSNDSGNVHSNHMPTSDLGSKTIPEDINAVMVVENTLPVETTELCETSVVPPKKGGWPKGKKRKVKPIISGPRQPVTGYVLYAMDRRKEIKESHPEIVFSEVTKILGQEWSTMNMEVKQKYLEAAEADKKRYREELKAFKSSDAYQEEMNKKRLINGQQSNDILNCDDDTSTDLFCKVCNVYFNNLHNKREHMYGKAHAQKVTGAMEKQLLQRQQEEAQLLMDSALVVSEELSQDGFQPELRGSDCHSLEGGSGGSRREGSGTFSREVDIHGFMNEFIQKNYEREQEISMLKKRLNKGLEENVAMCKEIQALQEYQNKLAEEQKVLDASNATLIAQSDALKLIPSLFGVDNL